MGLKRKPVTEAEEEEEAVHHLWKVIRRCKDVMCGLKKIVLNVGDMMLKMCL